MILSIPVETYRRDGEFLVCLSCNARTHQPSCRHEDGCPSVNELGLLSPRQQEIALWVARGKSPRWIAEHLGITAKTVSNHKEAVFRRFNIHTTAQLIHILYRLGVFTPEPKKEMSEELKAARSLQPDPTGGRKFGTWIRQ